MTGPVDRRTMRLCLLGCGKIAETHSRTLGGLKAGVECSFASRSLPKAQAFNARLGGVGAFGSYREAVGSPSVDVVAVVTPPSSHLEWTLAALEGGKDVILEKPPVLCSTDFDAVERACRATGRFVYVAENYHYKPLVARVRALLASGAVGEPLFVHLNAVKRQKTSDWRNDPAEAGGGALFEGGIHWVNFASSLGLTIRSVKAAAPGAGSGLERSMALLFAYAEGAVGLLSYSWEVASPLRGVRFSRIYGRQGSIAFESNGLVLATSGRRWSLQIPGVSDIQGYKAMFTDFVRAWRERTESSMTLARARRDLEIIEEAYRSAGVHQPPAAAGRRTD
jgi:UDP-N-acetylglucosamine 3-dehydrogenase